MDRSKTNLKKFHFIYRTTNMVNGRHYTGLHSTDDLEDGYLGSGKRFGYELNKYGRENFKREILEFLPSRAELKAREKTIVNEEMLKDPLCLNLKLGGEGGWDHAKNQSIAGKAGAAATKLKLMDADYRKAWSERSTAANLAAYENGRVPSGAFANKQMEMVERARSAPAVAKRKATYIERKHQQGEHNSQFGSAWVTNGTPIKIKRDQLDEYLSRGYRQGRK